MIFQEEYVQKGVPGVGGWSTGSDPTLLTTEAHVPSLVWEVRSHFKPLPTSGKKQREKEKKSKNEYMKDMHLSKHRVDFLDLINLRFLDLSVEH